MKECWELHQFLLHDCLSVAQHFTGSSSSCKGKDSTCLQRRSELELELESLELRSFFEARTIVSLRQTSIVNAT